MRVILASASPRRRELLERLGWEVEIRPTHVEETLLPGLSPAQQAMTLAARKAAPLLPFQKPDEVLISADTLVVHAGEILGKPRDIAEARQFLLRLSDSWHSVYTGVAIFTRERAWLFYEETAVRFHPLPPELIEIYLQKYPPLDKAGAYGAQDLIGLAGIAEIRGDFYNVMGLPVQKLLRFWYQLWNRLIPNEL